MTETVTIKRMAKKTERVSFVDVYTIGVILGIIFGDLVMGYLCVQAFLYHDMFYDDVWMLYGIMTGVFVYMHLTMGMVMFLFLHIKGSLHG